MVLSDTTVQENNTTFPTDGKLAKKVIDRCNSIADTKGIRQRQSYKRVSKQLLRETHNPTHPKQRIKARKAQLKLRTLVGRQLRELERNLSNEATRQYDDDLDLYRRVIQQRKDDKNKIYSLHKPFTCCIAKGKVHKQYEFGNKIGLMVNPQSLVILGIESFVGNPHDSHTIEPLLNQVERNFQYKPQEVVYDRGGRGRTEIKSVKISTANKPLKRDSEYVKRTKRKKFRRRAAIEPVIGHLKQHFRMGQNYLNGDKSPKINALLAASAWNFEKLMEKIKQKDKNFFFEILRRLSFFEISKL